MAGNAFWAIPDALRVMMTEWEDYFRKTGHFCRKTLNFEITNDQLK